MSSELAKLLQCGNCNQRYNNVTHRPKLLVCHHCFCMQCIQTFIQLTINQSAICPLCLKITSVGRNGVPALPDNDFILPQLELLNSALNERKRYKPPSPPIQEEIEEDTEEDEPDDNIFVSDEDVDPNFNDDKFVSDEDDVDAHFTVDKDEEVLIFCWTCMSLALQPCITEHEICNYDIAVKKLQGRLAISVQQAKENLKQEILALEESSKLLGCVHTAWTSLANNLDHSCTSQVASLSSARSLLETLPDPDLATECAKTGDPTSLALAVSNTEDTLKDSMSRNTQHKIESSVWKSISKCNVNLRSNNTSTTITENMNFGLEFNEKAKEDGLCSLFGISKLLEAKIKSDLTQSQVKEEEEIESDEENASREENESDEENASREDNESEEENVSREENESEEDNERVVEDEETLFRERVNKTRLKQQMQVNKQKPPFKSRSYENSIKPLSNNTTITNTKVNGTHSENWNELTENNTVYKRMPKPMTSGCAYCFFDLLQGHTELGRVIMEVSCKAAPKMAKNFIELCTGKHGFGYSNSKLWKISSGDHVDGGDIPEGGQCSIYGKEPFLGDASTLQDDVGMLRMRGRGTSQDGQPIVGSQFMVWIKQRNFKNYTRTLVFGRVVEGIDILGTMPETRQRKGKPFIPPVTIIQCGIME